MPSFTRWFLSVRGGAAQGDCQGHGWRRVACKEVKLSFLGGCWYCLICAPKYGFCCVVNERVGSVDGIQVKFLVLEESKFLNYISQNL